MLLTGFRSITSVLTPPLGRLIGEVPNIDLPLLKVYGRD
jgi:hypothetical protein